MINFQLMLRQSYQHPVSQQSIKLLCQSILTPGNGYKLILFLVDIKINNTASVIPTSCYPAINQIVMLGYTFTPGNDYYCLYRLSSHSVCTNMAIYDHAYFAYYFARAERPKIMLCQSYKHPVSQPSIRLLCSHLVMITIYWYIS